MSKPPHPLSCLNHTSTSDKPFATKWVLKPSSWKSLCTWQIVTRYSLLSTNSGFTHGTRIRTCEHLIHHSKHVLHSLLFGYVPQNAHKHSDVGYPILHSQFRYSLLQEQNHPDPLQFRHWAKQCLTLSWCTPHSQIQRSPWALKRKFHRGEKSNGTSSSNADCTLGGRWS
jgi:hypothetical protein